MEFVRIPISESGARDLDVYVGTQFLGVGVEYGVPHLFCLMDRNRAPSSRVVWVYRTGDTVSYPQKKTHVGTFELEDEHYHVFTDLDRR